MIPQTLPHKFRLMGSAFDGTLNQSVSETHEAMSVGSYMDSYFLLITIKPIQKMIRKEHTKKEHYLENKNQG